MTTAIRPVLAASVAVFRGGKVLLARRAAAPGAGLWSLPGGRVEAGETAAEAALRELDEEVQVRAQIVGLAGVLDVILKDSSGALTGHFVVIAHAGRWLEGEPQTGIEAVEVGWFHPHEVAGLTTTDGLAQMVLAAADVLGRLPAEPDEPVQH